MRKLLPGFLAALLLAACTEIVTVGPSANLHVYNSAWQKVAEAEVRAVDSAVTLEEFVDEYNATHTDDQLFLVEGSEVPIEQAPDAPAFIVNAATLAVYWTDVVERADLSTRRDAWRVSVEVMADPDTGIIVPCTLYVDHLPPEPPVIVVPLPKLWVALLNHTTTEIFYSAQYPTEAEALVRYNSLRAQADLYNLGIGDGPGLWSAYLGDREFAW